MTNELDPGGTRSLGLFHRAIAGATSAAGLRTRRGGADLATETGRHAERNRRAGLTSISGVGSRLASIAVSFITVPILLHHLGVERYGIWLTVSAGAAWLGLVQFGVAPSLVNRLSAVPASDTQHRRDLTSTAWWVAVAIGAIALVPLVLLYQVASWADIFNVAAGPLAEDGRAVAALVWIGVAVGLPFGIPFAILRARQEGYLANALEAGGSIARLVLLLVLVALDVPMVGLAFALLAFGLVMGALGAGIVFGARSPELRPQPDRFDRSIARSLLGTGASFTGLSIGALVIGYTDLIVITQVLGPAQVPTYAVAFSLLTMFVGIELAILDAVWPAYSEAAAIGDRRWLRVTHHRVTLLFMAGATLFGAGLILLGQPVVGLWAGPEVVPPMSLLVTLAVLAVVQAYQLPHGRMLTALGHVRLNSILGLLNAAINLPLSIILATHLGITGVAIGTLVGYLAIGAVLVVRARRVIAADGPVVGAAAASP